MNQGDILGPYRVLDKLGQGGMGEVYRGTGEGRIVLLVGGDMIGRTVGVSRDSKWITYTGTEGDIWIAIIRQDAR